MISRDVNLDAKENVDVDSEDGVADFHFSSRLTCLGGISLLDDPVDWMA